MPTGGSRPDLTGPVDPQDSVPRESFHGVQGAVGSEVEAVDRHSLGELDRADRLRCRGTGEGCEYERQRDDAETPGVDEGRWTVITC